MYTPVEFTTNCGEGRDPHLLLPSLICHGSPTGSPPPIILCPKTLGPISSMTHTACKERDPLVGALGLHFPAIPAAKQHCRALWELKSQHLWWAPGWRRQLSPLLYLSLGLPRSLCSPPPCLSPLPTTSCPPRPFFQVRTPASSFNPSQLRTCPPSKAAWSLPGLRPLINVSRATDQRYRLRGRSSAWQPLLRRAELRACYKERLCRQRWAGIGSDE